jgi:hypothetical protein
MQDVVPAFKEELDVVVNKFTILFAIFSRVYKIDHLSLVSSFQFSSPVTYDFVESVKEPDSSPCLWTSPSILRKINSNRLYFKDRAQIEWGLKAVYSVRLSVSSQSSGGTFKSST